MTEDDIEREVSEPPADKVAEFAIAEMKRRADEHEAMLRSVGDQG